MRQVIKLVDNVQNGGSDEFHDDVRTFFKLFQRNHCGDITDQVCDDLVEDFTALFEACYAGILAQVSGI